jgi:hypothetical protein
MEQNEAKTYLVKIVSDNVELYDIDEQLSLIVAFKWAKRPEQLVIHVSEPLLIDVGLDAYEIHEIVIDTVYLRRDCVAFTCKIYSTVNKRWF